MTTQFNLEQLDGLKRKLSATIPLEQVSSAYSKKLNEVQKQIKMPGFRPGKVPQNLVEQRHGKDLLNEVASELIDSSFKEFMENEKLTLAMRPEIVPSDIEKGKSIEYSASFEVMPEIELTDLAGCAVEKTVVNLSDEEKSSSMEKVAKKQASWTLVERAAALGDKVTFDFAGSIDGVLFDGGSSENFELELGSNQMIPGFEDQIVGISAGEEKDITVTFPEAYGVADLAGKDAVFNIKAHEVKEAALPELNDEFAKKLGVDNLADLETQVYSMASKGAEDKVQSEMYVIVTDLLLDKNKVDVPESLLNAEINHLKSASNNENKDETDESYSEKATKRVSLGLLLAEVIKKNEIKLDESMMQQRVLSMMSAHHDPKEVMQYFEQNSAAREDLKSQVLEQQAIEKLLESADVTEVSKTLAEVIES